MKAGDGGRGHRAIALLLGLLACRLPAGAPPPPPTLDPDLVQHGALLFLDPGLSGGGGRSCAGCHPGGGQNGKTYREGEEVRPGTPGGWNVPSLRGAWQTPPYLWDGSAASLRQALRRCLEVEMRGRRATEGDLAALETYLLSIPVFDRGRIDPHGAPIEPATLFARRGFELFESQGCGRCHPPPSFTQDGLVEIGGGRGINPPTLRGVGSSAPYGHDGRWPTLDAVVRAELQEHGSAGLTEREIAQLLAYLRLL